MNRNRQIRTHQLHQPQPLFRIHGNHQQGHSRRRDRRSAEMDEHEIDVLARVAGRYFVQFGDEEGVAGDVDSVMVVGGWLMGCRLRGKGGKGGRGR